MVKQAATTAARFGEWRITTLAIRRSREARRPKTIARRFATIPRNRRAAAGETSIHWPILFGRKALPWQRERKSDPFGARDSFETGQGHAALFRLSKLEKLGLANVAELPFSIRLLLESALRNCDGFEVREDDVKNLAGWNAAAPAQVEIPFKPARVLLQDFTGVPAVVDLAAMRAAMRRLGGDPKRINPLIPVDLVIDHSVQVDRFGIADSLTRTSSWNSSATASGMSSCAGAKRRSTISASFRRRSESCTR